MSIAYQEGMEALRRYDWMAARAAFETALIVAEAPETYEGLATALRWLVAPEDELTAASGRAYRLFVARGDLLGAGRMAWFIGSDVYDRTGEAAIGNGWMQRARRHLLGQEDTPEFGWVVWAEGYLGLMEANDTTRARAAGVRAASLGRVGRALDLEMMGLALEGLALVSEGAVAEGMSRLDEAATAAISGDISDPNWRASACCFVIDACGRVRDYDRGLQWCLQTSRLVHDEIHVRSFYSVCRPGYAQVMIWKGDWADAESELQFAAQELSETWPPYVGESLTRLAELRVRQGRLEEAEALFAQVEGDPISLLGRANLSLAKGEAAAAVELCERYMRRIPESARAEQAAARETLVPALLADDRLDRAEAACRELEKLSEAMGTAPFRAAARLATGLVRANQGLLDEAQAALEDGLDLCEAGGGRFEAARIRLELADVLRRKGRLEAAVREARSSWERFTAFGAAHLAARAAAFLAACGSPLEPDRSPAGGLTLREREVLTLLASGLSNRAVAADLVLSVRTVERHVSNIYAKIGAEGQAARATAVAFASEHGLVPTRT